MPYGYRGLKIFTSLSLRFQDFQRWKPAIEGLLFNLKTVPSHELTVTHTKYGKPSFYLTTTILVSYRLLFYK